MECRYSQREKVSEVDTKGEKRIFFISLMGVTGRVGFIFRLSPASLYEGPSVRLSVCPLVNRENGDLQTVGVFFTKRVVIGNEKLKTNNVG